MRRSIWLLPAILFALATLVAGVDVDRPVAPLVEHGELLAELRSAPRENPDRVQRLRELYLQAGAAKDDVVLQEVLADRAPPLHNVIVTKRGQSDSVIVVGGHLDKVSVGDGVIDDWSGSCLATNLYQTLRSIDTHHTFVFMGFAHEEQGLVGSSAYVKSLTETQRKQIRAMVNLECLGVSDAFVWSNGSTDMLEAIAYDVAARHELPLREHVIVGVGADSMSFDRVGIPTITFDGLPLEQIRLIHSPQDTFASIHQSAYCRTYEFVARYLLALDSTLAAANAEQSIEQKVEELVRLEMVKRHIPGLSVVVNQNNKTVFTRGFGVANLEHAVPATPDTVYQLGSLTKQFTATSILLLARANKLALDDVVGKYLDDIPDTWKPVTIRQLLTHTSGIKSYTSVAGNRASFRNDRSPKEILETVAADPLDFPAGTKWSYSNTGYFLLGLVVEKVSGRRYSQFLYEQIFQPVGMTSTRVNDPRDVISDRATGYAWDGRICRNGEFASMTWPFAAGALIGTARDLATWDAALSGEVPLSAAERTIMWTRATLADGATTDYGLGWALGTDRGHKVVEHGGGIPGFSTYIGRYPDANLCVVVLCNLESGNPATIARQIAAIYLPDRPTPEK